MILSHGLHDSNEQGNSYFVPPVMLLVGKGSMKGISSPLGFFRPSAYPVEGNCILLGKMISLLRELNSGKWCLLSV
ncbi:unnamed protein product [Musa acuminata subsp. malaccensis]|uniref:(wild Malaysian banana) hypothetical protein n=1 Tax=Musa acuminata subsp. malaccensis TaxID=214687 RepID=A0A804JR62_MUSAM|nr:unnamed protein product [Musa acuminata subsp. malaccensis]